MPTNSWIFQANPDRFDVERFLAAKPATARWRVTSGANHMQAGDTVYIWRAVGDANKDANLAGIIGRAVIEAPVDKRADDSSARAFWLDKGDAETVMDRVAIRITDLFGEPRIPRSGLLQDPVLKARQIIKAPQGTNFRLGADEAARIDALWDAMGTPWSDKELVAGLVAYRRGGGVDDRAGWLSALVPRLFLDARGRIARFSGLDPAFSHHVPGGTGPEATAWDRYFGPKGKGEAALGKDFAKAWPKA